MEDFLLIAIIAALLNMLFSIIVPPLLNKTTAPFIEEIKNHYKCNKQFILISSILTVILVYISLTITPFVKLNLFSALSDLNVVNNIQIPQL